MWHSNLQKRTRYNNKLDVTATRCITNFHWKFASSKKKCINRVLNRQKLDQEDIEDGLTDGL
ncbi:hypothetical protein CVS40_4895 [Lucilia cuprina]|nr:hypothetical protein CVS40_4895 [Lucilia cuprina]